MLDPEAPRAIAVIIVNYRTPDLALRSAAALAVERVQLPTLQVLIVDGGSGDGSADILRAGIAELGLAAWVSVLALPINGGFGWANNQGISMLLQVDQPPDYIHLLNPDTLIESGAVSSLAKALDECPACAAVGSLLINEDGTTSGSAFRFPSPGRELARGARTDLVIRLLGIEPLLVQDAPSGPVDWVTGASTMIRATALREVGMFDTGFFLYFEEVELMWRFMRAGWTIRHEPTSRVVHVGGAATGVNYNLPRDRKLPPLPTYWFRARRRMFTRLYGPGVAFLASLAWLTGYMLYQLRHVLGLGGDHLSTAHELRDLLRAGIRASRHDREAAVAQYKDPPGQVPAWMAWADQN